MAKLIDKKQLKDLLMSSQALAFLSSTKRKEYIDRVLEANSAEQERVSRLFEEEKAALDEIDENFAEEQRGIYKKFKTALSQSQQKYTISIRKKMEAIESKIDEEKINTLLNKI